MSEKRFRTMSNEVKQWYCIESVEGEMFSIQEVVDLLNEQQATIEQLRQSQDVKEFSALFNQSIALQREIKDLKEENEQLREIINKLEEAIEKRGYDSIDEFW